MNVAVVPDPAESVPVEVMSTVCPCSRDGVAAGVRAVIRTLKDVPAVCVRCAARGLDEEVGERAGLTVNELLVRSGRRLVRVAVIDELQV